MSLFVSNPLDVLIEAASNDIMTNTSSYVRESQVLSRYEDLEEVSEDLNINEHMVPVIAIDGEFFTEMQYLAPFMECSGVRSVAEALDIVSKANNLPPRSIGLLVESQECVTQMIEKALGKGPKSKEKAVEKVAKAESLIDGLKKKGVKVKKKKSSGDIKKKKGKLCPKCGKNPCKCKKGKVKSKGFTGDDAELDVEEAYRFW